MGGGDRQNKRKKIIKEAIQYLKKILFTIFLICFKKKGEKK